MTQEQRIPPLQYSPVRERHYLSAHLEAACEYLAGCGLSTKEVATMPSDLVARMDRLVYEAAALLKHYGSPRPPEANEDQTNG